MSSTLITFEGLMIFHHDQSDLYEVGVVDTRDLNHHFPRHDFEVAITPDPHVQQGKWVLGPADLDPYLHQGNSWSLNVEDAQGNLLRGILVDESFPNRHSQDPADRRFGWIINLESNEFHKGHLHREPGKLKPVMHLSKGNLFTYCKTGGVDATRGGSSEDLGFIAATIALEIDTSAGEVASLKVDDTGTEIFRLTKGISYEVAITNTTAVISTMSHFHAYYDVVFRDVPHQQRFDFKARPNAPSPNPCADETQPDEMAIRREGLTMFSPPPYKCGGLAVDPKGEPLV